MFGRTLYARRRGIRRGGRRGVVPRRRVRDSEEVAECIRRSPSIIAVGKDGAEVSLKQHPSFPHDLPEISPFFIQNVGEGHDHTLSS